MVAATEPQGPHVDQLAGHPWDRVDELIEFARQDAIDAQALPESLAFVFHDDGLSGMLFTPTFLAETADEITAQLCHVLPSLHARGIAVIWPAQYPSDDGAPWWAMKVHRWDAASPGRMRTQIWPLPIHGTPDGPPATVDPPDPWSQQLARALTAAMPLARLGVVDTTGLPDGYEFLTAPGGPLADLVPTRGLN